MRAATKVRCYGFFPIFLLLINSCVSDSSLKEEKPPIYKLIFQTSPCPSRVEQRYIVEKAYGKFISGSDKAKNNAFKTLTLVPEEYLNWIFLYKNSQITLQDSQAVASTNLLYHSGQLSFLYLKTVFPDLEENLNALVTEYTKGKKEFKEAEKKPSSAELFAEIFDSYYCGKKSRAKLKKEFAKAHNLAANHFINPQDLNFGRTKDTPQGIAKIVDSDRDGIANAFDTCPRSPEGADVAINGPKTGC